MKHNSEFSYSNAVASIVTPKKMKVELAKPIVGNSGDQERIETEMTDLETVFENSFLPPTSEENYPQRTPKVDRTPV